MVLKNGGIIAMGAFIPANDIPERIIGKLIDFLHKCDGFPAEYIESMEKYGVFPGRIETNYDGWESQPWFQAWLDALPEKKRDEPFQGTLERRRVPDDPSSVRESIYPHPMLPSDAETIAGAVAIINSGLTRGDIDLVLAHSQVQDVSLPANVSLIQHRLGLTNSGAYGVDSCCSSFVTMVELAESLVRSGVKKNVLLVGSYLDSHVNDKSDYFSVNTGDAAVAGIVSEVEGGCGYLSSHSTSDGSRHNGIIFKRRPPHLFKHACAGPDYAREHVTFYNRAANLATAENAEKEMKEVVYKALGKTGFTIGDVDFFVTHQPVSWAGEFWRKTLGFPEEKFYNSFERYGNIGTCSVPVNFLEAVERGLIAGGDNVLIASSGSGDNHIAVLEKISSRLIESNRVQAK